METNMPPDSQKLNTNPVENGRDVGPDDGEETSQHSSAVTDASNNDDATASFNPSNIELIEGDITLASLRGDAIGDTMYSARFVFSTLLKLTYVNADYVLNEETERDLCALWDMTVEEDVITLFMDHSVLEVFAEVISVASDKRIIEIVVGMIANMCKMPETRAYLCDHTLSDQLLCLVTYLDTPILTQLTRLIAAMIIDGDLEDWFEHFCQIANFTEDFCYILENNINVVLLGYGMEALNAILAKFATIVPQPRTDDEEVPLGFSEVFAKECVIKSTIEAFKVLVPSEAELEEEGITTETVLKHIEIFLNIHNILADYGNDSLNYYMVHLAEILGCFGRILQLLGTLSQLFPLTANHLAIVRDVGDLYEFFGNPFDELCAKRVFTIWSHLLEKDESRADEAGNDFEIDSFEADKILSQEFRTTIQTFVEHILQNASIEQLQPVLRSFPESTVFKFKSSLVRGHGCNLLKRAYQTLVYAEKDGT